MSAEFKFAIKLARDAGSLILNASRAGNSKMDCFSIYSLFFFKYTWYFFGEIRNLNKCSFFCGRCFKRPFYSFDFFCNNWFWIPSFFN